MAERGAFSVTATASTLVAANPARSELIIEHYSGNPIYLAFGDDTPVKLTGIKLSVDVPVLVLTDYRKGLAVKGVCNDAMTATGGYQGA